MVKYNISNWVIRQLSLVASSMGIYRFEKLRVYQDALLLVENIYQLTKKIPIEERFALIDQLKRSSTSIVLNIAEGTGSKGDVEFKKFLRIALKSFYETIAGLKIAEKLFKVNIEKSLEISDKVGKELNALIKSLNQQATND
ncbi:MAG TPA: four helix bundle protein [Patescibacteria group bacterium]|nr:four helix bundle protein [Patescibacteria group bacterium]